MKETIDYAERLTRAALKGLPDGQWQFEDWIDDDGVDYGKPIRLFVTIKKKGGHMVVDWTGTNPQVKGAINNTLSFTKAASYTGVRSVLPQGIPNNEGVFRAIEVICPPGTVGNGVLPADRLHVRRARDDAPGQGQGRGRRRQHRRLDRRL